jgi:hypothetical protein
MSKRTIGTLALLAALALPGTALAKYDANGGGGGSAGPPTAGSCDLILGTTFTAGDELSANEKILADAWRSHLHARKAAAFIGLG